jgi:hypothetical protein
VHTRGWWYSSLLLFVVPVWGTSASAQTAYNAQAAFAPGFYHWPANNVRGANGAPGPAYWQNEANYRVAATLDTRACKLTGEVTIDYINHSPVSLPFLWLELDQNIDRKDSRASRINQPGSETSNPDGFHFQAVEQFDDGRWSPANYVVSDTRMQVRLARPLSAEVGRIRLRLQYHYHLLDSGGGGRSGILSTTNGRIFEISYW